MNTPLATISGLHCTLHRALNVRPDTPDFRDRLYEPALVDVPPTMSIDRYRSLGVPVLDQGTDGACTGFALATVANVLLRMRRTDPDLTPVSPRMFYEMARRYDEWIGERYEGSSARGAMKGWHKHGVCAESDWPQHADPHEGLSEIRARSARNRPLGAYFRVDHRDLVAMHAAMAEAGVLYATAAIHDGWTTVDRTGRIAWNRRSIGSHAFAIVAYDRDGFWIQNSWGALWGADGFGHLSYADWLSNGHDGWVARLGAPIELQGTQGDGPPARTSPVESHRSISNPHWLALEPDGRLRRHGRWAMTVEDIALLLQPGGEFDTTTRRWDRKRILLIAHGGLTHESHAIESLSDRIPSLLSEEIFPIGIVWNSDFHSTLTSLMRRVVLHRRLASHRRSTGDVMHERMDDAVEWLARSLGGAAIWDQMKRNARASSERNDGGLRILIRHLLDLVARDPSIELHIVGHSAGAIVLSAFIRQFAAMAAGARHTISTATLWAPANTIEDFNQNVAPSLESGRLGRLHLFTLTEEAERADSVAGVYLKSILYLVSNALEVRPAIPGVCDGTPLLGLASSIEGDAGIMRQIALGALIWTSAPTSANAAHDAASLARTHGEFNADAATWRSLYSIIQGPPESTIGVPNQRDFRNNAPMSPTRAFLPERT